MSRHHITAVSEKCIFVKTSLHTAAAADDADDADDGDDGNDVDGDDVVGDLGRLSCLSEEPKPGSRLFLQHSPHHLVLFVNNFEQLSWRPHASPLPR